MPAKKLREGSTEPPRQVTAPLPPALKSARKRDLWQIAAGRKDITPCPARNPRHFAKGVRDQRLVEQRRSVRPERGNQPGLGFSGANGAGKDSHGRGTAMLVPTRRERDARATRAHCVGFSGPVFASAGCAWPWLRAG